MNPAFLRDQRGFTLLEVLVAFAMIVVIVFAAVLSQSQGLVSASRDRNLVIATHLARNVINEHELLHEGKPLEQLPEKESGTAEADKKEFKWTIEYSKVDFSALTDLISRQNAKQNGGNASGDNQQQTDMVLKIFKDYLEKSVRRMKLTIEWPEGKGTSSQTFTELLVDYDTEMNVGI